MPQQIEEVERFLSTHLEELCELRTRPGVECAQLDFGWDVPGRALVQWNVFPRSLLALCAQANLDLVVSVYVTDSWAVFEE